VQRLGLGRLGRARDHPVMDIVPNKALSLSLSLSESLSLSLSLGLRLELRLLGLRSGFDPPDLDRPGRLPHQL